MSTIAQTKAGAKQPWHFHNGISEWHWASDNHPDVNLHEREEADKPQWVKARGDEDKNDFIAPPSDEDVANYVAMLDPSVGKGNKPRGRRSNASRALDGTTPVVKDHANQRDVPEGKKRWYCTACAKSFIAEGTEQPDCCNKGHMALDKDGQLVTKEMAPTATTEESSES